MKIRDALFLMAAFIFGATATMIFNLNYPLDEEPIKNAYKIAYRQGVMHGYAMRVARHCKMLNCTEHSNYGDDWEIDKLDIPEVGL